LYVQKNPPLSSSLQPKFDIVIVISERISLASEVDLLYKEAWRPKQAAMGNSTLQTVLDKLCIVANINSRKLIEYIKAEIKIRESKILGK
jgi:hypothetical protein